MNYILDVDYLELANENLAKRYYAERVTYKDGKNVIRVEREELSLAGADEGGLLRSARESRIVPAERACGRSIYFLWDAWRSDNQHKGLCFRNG